MNARWQPWSLLAAAIGAVVACSHGTSPDEPSTSGATQNIVDGQPATDAKFDAVGAIVIKTARFDIEYTLCTATLIAPQVALTAKHCIGTVAQGQWPITNAFLEFGASASKPIEKVQIKAFRTAPDEADFCLMQNAGSACRDLAVLYLDSAPKQVTPTRLGKFDPSMVGEQFEIAGFGRRSATIPAGSKFMGQVTARATEGEWYRLLFNNDWDAYDLFYWTDADSSFDPDEELAWWEPGTWTLEPGYELLAGGLPGEATGCFGDSGGPILRGTNALDMTVYGVSFATEASGAKGCSYGGAYLMLNDEMLAFVEQSVAMAPAYLDK